MLSTHPDVAAVAIVPRADDVMGEIGVAVVVAARSRNAAALAALREFAAPHVAAYKLPEAIHVVDALPLTVGEKIDRRALAEQTSRSIPPGNLLAPMELEFSSRSGRAARLDPRRAHQGEPGPARPGRRRAGDPARPSSGRR